MLKKAVFASVMTLFAIATIATAQNKPIKSLGQLVSRPAQAPVMSGHLKAGPATPPSYCAPGCLFYGGDIDANSPSANGLASEKDVIVSQAAVWSPFVVPTGHTWTITKIFANFLTINGALDPMQADWAIATGVSSGNPGTVIASGTDQAITIPTGRTAFGLPEFTVSSRLSSSVVLTEGTYFMNVTPYCTNTGNNSCLGQRFFESDSPDQPALNGRGHEPKNDSFFNSTFFGADYQPTWGSSGSCGGIGCNRFSAGLVGTSQ